MSFVSFHCPEKLVCSQGGQKQRTDPHSSSELNLLFPSFVALKQQRHCFYIKFKLIFLILRRKIVTMLQSYDILMFFKLSRMQVRKQAKNVQK